VTFSPDTEEEDVVPPVQTQRSSFNKQRNTEMYDREALEISEVLENAINKYGSLSDVDKAMDLEDKTNKQNKQKNKAEKKSTNWNHFGRLK